MKKKKVIADPLVVGEEVHTTHGEVVIVLSTFYKNNRKFAWVEFQDETKYVTSVVCGNILNGVLHNPYRRSVCGVGYFGEGVHLSSGGLYDNVYTTWRMILRRAYEPAQKTRKIYKVCTTWHNYQVFAEWYIANRPPKGIRTYFIFDGLGENTYLYSPDTCYLSDTLVK